MKLVGQFLMGCLMIGAVIGLAFLIEQILPEARAGQENPTSMTSIAMQVKIFSNPISNNNDVRKQELENDFNKWMQDNWKNIGIDRIDTNSNSGFLHIVVLYKRKLN